MVYLEGAWSVEAIVDGGVVSECDPLCEGRPLGVMVVGQEPEAAVPEPPKDLDGPVASGVVTEGRRGADVRGLSQQCERNSGAASE